MKITIRDIAARAGVSKTTVSRVLNNHADGVGQEKRQLIEAILAETGFQPSGVARGLATGHSRTIGLIIPDITNPFYPQLVRGVEGALIKAGYNLFLCNTAADMDLESKYVALLLEKGVDGVILDSAGSDCDCQLELLAKKGIPYILLDRVITGDSLHRGVYVDNCAGAEMAANHLFERSDSSLLFINGPAHLSQSQERLTGVEKVVREREIPPERYRVVNGDFSIEGTARLMSRMLDLAKWKTADPLPFNALFAANDQMAIGAMRAMKTRGIRIPEDVEVIGFDGIELSQLVDPPLSTVEQPMLKMGARSADLLLQMLAGDSRSPKTVVMKPRLVLRGSTRAR